MGLLVGICGGSGSGKSTLAELVAGVWRERRGPDTATVLSFDLYYHDQSHLPPAERAQVNYDHPDSLDAELLAFQLEELRAGREVAAPGYDFASYRRTGDLALVAPAELIVVEGILLFAFAPLRELLDYRVFRNCPEDVRFARRRTRDVVERGRTVGSVETQLAATVKPMHDRYVQPFLDQAHFVTEHGQDLDHIAGLLVDQLDQLVASGTRTG